MAVEKQVLSYVPVKWGTHLLTAVLEKTPFLIRAGGETSKVNGAGDGVYHLPCRQSLLPEEIKLRLEAVKESEVCCCQQHILVCSTA